MSFPRENGGALIADVLVRHGIRHLFTLCGGHISPILVEAKRRGLTVVDVRDEGNAVFAADAVARMTGRPGVAAVTAGPGVTNAVTAMKNAQMAQTPLLLFGGATATVLRGRGSLQDIDQMSLMRPLTKWAVRITTVADLAPVVDRALDVAKSGVPGPVFIEVPVDLLYPESLVREWYLKEAGVANAKTLAAKALGLYLEGHLYRQFHAPRVPIDLPPPELHLPRLRDLRPRVADVAAEIARADKPVLVIGSQAMVSCTDPDRLAAAVRKLGLPTFLGGSARGLLGRESAQQFRHARGAALKQADLVIIAGFPFDFRLGYGRGISSKATLVSANLSSRELTKNRRPEITLRMHAGEFLVDLAAAATADAKRLAPWFDELRAREHKRDEEIAEEARTPGELVNPLDFFLRLDKKMADDATLVVDGGDFVATASYIVRPRAPLKWLDPGVFGTLGVGGGFAAGAALVNPGKEVWLIYGDGSSAYSLAEFDTFARHGLAPIAVIGNDGSWQQIAREQVEVLGDDVGTVLARCDYHKVAEGYGGVGLLLTDPAKIDATLDEAKAIARKGKPVCINVHIRKSEFRKGSISM
jgi:acetolactate synthase-1/2/3 large subunit